MLKKKNGSENKGMFWLGILAYPDYTAITKKKGSLWEYVIPALHKGPWTKTIRTKAFHPNLYPWKQKVTPPSYHNWQSPGSLTACLLSLSSNSSPASSVCVLGGGVLNFLWKNFVYSYQNHLHPSSIHPSSTHPSWPHSKSQPVHLHHSEGPSDKDDAVNDAPGAVPRGSSKPPPWSPPSTPQQVKSPSLSPQTTNVSHVPTGV